MRTLFTTLLLTFFLFATSASGEDTDSAEPESPSFQVTVTADRLEEPVTDKTDAVTVITSEEIEQHQWHHVNDVLEQVPGLILLQSGSPGKVTSVFLRGAGSSQVLVLVDGVQVNSPYFGGINFEDLTTDNVERIEVIKGPQSPLYGSESIGGIIHIITRRGEGSPKVNASFEGGSFNTFREKAGISGSQNNLNYAFTFSRQDSDGILDNDEFNENSFSGRAGYTWDNATSLDFTTQVYDSEAGLPFDFVSLPALLQNQDTSTVLFGTHFTHSTGNLFNLNASFSIADRDYHYENPENTFAPEQDNTSRSYEFNVQNDFQVNDINVISAGYEYETDDIEASDSNGPSLNQTIRNHGIFLQEKLETQHVILTAGFRYDHFNSFGDTVNPRVGIAYRFTPNTKVRASYGRGFRAPSAGDLAFPFYGNPDLRPEKSESWEVGVDHFFNSRTSINASWFHNDYEDLITFDPQTLIAGNIASAMSQGLELAASFQYGAWNLGGGYTYLDTEDKSTGLQLFRRPKHSGNFRIAYQTNKWGGSFSMYSYSERLESDFRVFPSQNVFNPGFIQSDVAVHYQIIPAMRVRARVENIFDEDYEPVLGFPAPGRGAYAGIEASF
jgi:vitamin B12 transporter